MENLYIVLKTLLAYLSLLGIGFAPMTGGGDFAPSEPVEPGDQAKYLQIEAPDQGIDIWNPGSLHGGYRYGPSMILNKDGSIDIWCAANGPGDIVDVAAYKRLYDGGRRCTKETVALKPTSGDTHDWKWTCDPGAVKFGDYYYIGYTTTLDERGTDNDMCVARAKSPEGPFIEKWDGSGWSENPVPVVEYTGNPDCWGVGEPSFVVMGDALYVYFSWCDEKGAATWVATADATDENWPATLEIHGECIPPKNGGDSADVKYVDAFGRFVAVFTEKRFSDDSYVAVWESFDGLTFRRSGFVKANTGKKLHNCGISGRADGHIGAGDPVYLGYAYGSDWGNWSTRLHEVKLSLADAPKTDDGAEENIEIPVSRRPDRILPEITMIKGEKQHYTIEKSTQIFVMAMDSDGYTFPLLTGATFDGYDKSVVKIVGSRMYPVGEGVTRVHAHWHGLHADFTVTARPSGEPVC